MCGEARMPAMKALKYGGEASCRYRLSDYLPVGLKAWRFWFEQCRTRE